MRSEASSSSGGSRGESVVMDCGRRRSSCGYCRSGGRTSISHGLWANSITVDDYQDLLDRGWRRSGCFLYKPEMERTCCPSYTIRLKASDFVPSKEQRRVYRRMQRFLDGTLDLQKQVELTKDPDTPKGRGTCFNDEVSSSKADESLSGNNKGENKAEEFICHLSDQIDSMVRLCIESGEFPSDVQLPKAGVKRVSHAKKRRLVEGSEDLLFSSNVAFQIAATLRRVQLLQKDVCQSNTSEHNTNKNYPCPKLIAEKLACSLNQQTKVPGLCVKACNGHINFYSAANRLSSDKDVQIVYSPEESTAASGSKSSTSMMSSENLQGKKRKLEIYLKRSSFDQEEYELYKRYQLKVHNDTPDHVTESSYRRFLVDTPLLFVPSSGEDGEFPCGFGSFHQQYIIDGRLVAVGVIDILPKCLSSKYLFWDPDYAFLSLGKYSALQEIGWVKENQAHCPSLQYYYLGYYIHSCSKMRYKAAYCPSELLCPLRYQWIPFDVARPLLDKNKYVVLSDFATLQNGQPSRPSGPHTVLEIQNDDFDQQDLNDVPMNECEETVEPETESSDDELEPEVSGLMSGIEDGGVSKILIGLRGSRLRYEDLQRAFGPSERAYLEAQLRSYQKVVGVELSERMTYSLG